MCRSAIETDRIVVNMDIFSGLIMAQNRECYPLAKIIIDQIVMDIYIFHIRLFTFGAEENSPITIMHNILINLDVMKFTKPTIDINSFPQNIMAVIMMHFSMIAEFFDVDPFLLVHVEIVIG